MNICLPHKIRARCITYLSSTPINRKNSKSSLRSTRINDTASIQRNYTQYPHIFLLLPQKCFTHHISSHQLFTLQAASYSFAEPIVIHLSSRKLAGTPSRKLTVQEAASYPLGQRITVRLRTDIAAHWKAASRAINGGRRA